jgi:hypothetical protein
MDMHSGYIGHLDFGIATSMQKSAVTQGPLWRTAGGIAIPVHLSAELKTVPTSSSGKRSSDPGALAAVSVAVVGWSIHSLCP